MSAASDRPRARRRPARGRPDCGRRARGCHACGRRQQEGSGGTSEGGARARLFVALTLERDVSARLASWAREALGGQPGARLLDLDALHLTLCFLGEIPLGAVEAISAAVVDAVGAAVDGPLEFEPEGVRWLPPRRPRVCAVSLRDRDGRGAGLQAALSGRLSEGGWYEPERRRWLAHVTVARMSRGARVGEAPAPPQLEPFPGAAVALMRSWPGSRYETLARVAL